MISVLFAALCAAYDQTGMCIDRQVYPAGMWRGAEAPAQCEAEAAASRKRLADEGLMHLALLYCETESPGE